MNYQNREENPVCRGCGKRCLTKREAQDLLGTFKTHQEGHKYIPKRLYYCKTCGWYHVTHQVCSLKDAKKGNKYDFKKIAR